MAVKDGILNTYYKSGNIRYEVLFKNGFPIGSSKYFYETGEVKIESFYNNLGKLEGFSTKYYKNGKIKEKKIYKNGQKRRKTTCISPQWKSI